MKSPDAVSKEIRRIVLGTTVLTALMLMVYFLLGQLDAKVWLGALYGYALANGNFILLAFTVRKIADSAKPGDEDTTKMGKLRMQKSYSTRMLLGAILLIVALSVFKLNWVACCLPLLFPRIVILAKTAVEHLRKAKGSEIK